MGKNRKRKRARGTPAHGSENGKQSAEKQLPNKYEETIKRFKESTDESMVINKLQEKEQRALHLLCSKMELNSRCQGKGVRLFIYKGTMISKNRSAGHKFTRVSKKRSAGHKLTRASSKRLAEDKLSHFQFSEKSEAVLEDLFSRFPPHDVEMIEKKHNESSRKPCNSRMGDNMFLKPCITRSEIANEVAKFSSNLDNSPVLQKIAQARSKLPIASFKDDIISVTESNQVLLICGETGCGKTTQVPQFILESAWSKGENCKIICSQPRRISAVSVANRVASERGELIGKSVGYKIRLESSGGRNSSIVFCTNGVLLKILLDKGTCRTEEQASTGNRDVLSGITHIIMDEIHERDRYADFMLAIIRDLLPSYPHLHLVMMSATINAERFSQYFGGSPILHVPGFTYPVKSYYLEDVLSMVGSMENYHVTSTESNEPSLEPKLTNDCVAMLDEAIDRALSNDEFDPLLELLSSKGGDQRVLNHQHSQSGLTPLMVFAIKGRVCDIRMLLPLGVNCNLRCNAGKTALDYALSGESASIIQKHTEKGSKASEDAKKSHEKFLSKAHRPDLLDFALIEQLLLRICNDSSEGAILVFLPGWDEITKTRDKLLANPFFEDASKFTVLPLHSIVPSEDQRKVFDRPPSGCRKIVLATNVAETSVTIDDVVFVVDSGRVKEKIYDPHSNVSTLRSSFISKASAKQREGRAGRCQQGICYHLYTKEFEASLQDFSLPEIKKMPAEELCLQVRMIDRSCKIEDFLQKLMDPPVHETILNGISFLKEMGALTAEEKLTDLGEKLGHLPVHPRTGKMLLVAILLNCLDPALTLACAADFKDPFLLPMDPEEKLQAMKVRLELASFYGGIGDQFALLAAFDHWRIAKENGKVADFCSHYCVSRNTMRMISGMRKQLESELVRCGLITTPTWHYSLNAHDRGILHAVVAAALYPNIGKTVATKNRRYLETGDGSKVRLHNRSTVARHKEKLGTPLLVFDEVTCVESDASVRKCSSIACLPLLLLASKIAVAPLTENCSKDVVVAGNEETMSTATNKVKVLVDEWLRFESVAIDAAHLYCLRERLSAALLHKVTSPHVPLPPHLDLSLHAIACVLSFDGTNGMLQPSKITLNINATTNKKKEKEMVSRRPDTKYTLRSSIRAPAQDVDVGCP